MLRAVVFAVVVSICNTVLAGTEDFPVEPVDPKWRLQVLEMDYRRVKRKGDIRAAIKILKKIVKIVPRNADWRMILSKSLLVTGELQQAIDEFREVLSVERDFLEAEVGIARARALQGNNREAKDALLRAAEKGHSVALMMRKRELRKYFKEFRFVLELLEADKPKIRIDRDPFKSPLRRRVKPGRRPKPKKKENMLPEKEQRRIASEVKRWLVVVEALLALEKPDVEQALEYYHKIVEACKKKKLFTLSKCIEILEEAHRIARQKFYPRIRTALRQQVLREVHTLLEKLSRAVERGDRESARGLNPQLLDTVRKVLAGEDEELKKKMKKIDAKRAQMYRVVEILDEFDREVLPRLALRGTITDKSSPAGAVAFFDILGPEGACRTTVSAGDQLAPFETLQIEKISDGSVRTRYRGVAVDMNIRGAVAYQKTMLP